MLPGGMAEQVTVVAGPVTGGALLAHTMAGLLDGRRPLTREPYSFAPIHHTGPAAPRRCRRSTPGWCKGAKVLLVDDVRNTGQTFQHCADLIAAAGGTVVCTAQIVDRGEAVVTLPMPNVALVEYPAPENHAGGRLPAVRAGAAGHGVLSGRPAPAGYFLRAGGEGAVRSGRRRWRRVPFIVSFSTVPL